MTSTEAPQGEPAQPRPSGTAQALVALLCLAALLFPFLVSSPEREGASVGNELVFDGRQLVTQHEVLSEIPESPSRLFDTLTTTWWGRLFPEQQLYRPLSSFTLGLAAAAAGEPYEAEAPGMTALPYKLFAVALKVICSLLVLEVATRLLGSTRMGLIAGLLFATLPVHGEAVFDVAGIAELLSTALALGAWYAWLAAGDRPLRRPAALGASLGLLFLAVHAKESAYVLPLVFFLTDAGRASSGGLGTGLRHALSKAPALIAAGVVLVAALGLRMTVLDGGLLPGAGAIDVVDNPLVEADPLTRAANGLRILASSLGIVFGLNPLSSNHLFSADYSLAQIEVLPPFAWQNLVGLGALVLIVGGAVALYPRCRTRATLLLAYFASLLVVANLFFPIGTIFAERLLFFPSVLVVLFVAPFLGRLGTAGVALAALVAVGNGYWTHARAATWSSDTELWEYTARESAEDSARAHYNLGIGYARDQLTSLAEQSFRRAIEIAPMMEQAYQRLATVRLATYDYEGAVEPLQRIVEIFAEEDGWAYDPDSDAPYASVLFRLTTIEAKDPGQAPERNLAFLDSLLARGLERPEVHVYRGETLVALDRLDEAEAAFRRAAEVGENNLAVDTLAKFLIGTGREEEARQVYEERLATLQAGTDADAATRLSLESARLRIVLDDAEGAFETVDRLLSGDTTPPRELLGRAHMLRGLARVYSAGTDPVAEAVAVRDAIDDLQVALALTSRLDSDTLSAATTLAELLYIAGREETAIELADRVLGYLPNPTLQGRKAALLMRQGEVEQALETVTTALEGMLGAEGRVLNEIEYSKARLLQLEAIRRTEGSQARAQVDALLEAERARGDFVGARIRATELARTDRFAELDGALLILRARPEPAGAELAATVGAYADTVRALVEAPNDSGLLLRAAELSRPMLDVGRGLAWVTRAIELTPESQGDRLAFALGLKASLLETEGRIEEALEAVERALALEGVSEQGRAALARDRDRWRALLGKDAG